jgi:hypothetical protein
MREKGGVKGCWQENLKERDGQDEGECRWDNIKMYLK